MYMYGIKYSRGGGIRKDFYTRTTYKFKRRRYFLDATLKDMSTYTIQEAKSHHAPPDVSVYPDSPWNRLLKSNSLVTNLQPSKNTEDMIEATKRMSDFVKNDQKQSPYVVALNPRQKGRKS